MRLAVELHQGAVGKGHGQFGHAFDLHVTVLQMPVIVGLQEDSADEPDDRLLVREDADDIGPPRDLVINDENRPTLETAFNW